MKAGVHILPAAEYHADPCDAPSLSSSIARTILAYSPLHAWTAHPRLNPNCQPTERAEFDLGSAAHAMLLEGGESIEVIDPEDYPTKTGSTPKGWTTDAMRAARDDARALGKIPCLPSQHADIGKMVEIALQAIAECADLSGLTLDDGTAEQTLIWQEPSGIWCRARPDWMSHDRKVQISYKSTAASANPAEWVKTGLGIGFDLQESFYQRGNRATGGPEDSQSIVLVQENSEPYACSFIALDPGWQALADEKCEEAIELWRRCMASGRWLGYSRRIHWVAAPVWATMRWEERESLDTRSGGKMLSAADLDAGIPG